MQDVSIIVEASKMQETSIIVDVSKMQGASTMQGASIIVNVSKMQDVTRIRDVSLTLVASHVLREQHGLHVTQGSPAMDSSGIHLTAATITGRTRCREIII